jgi:hypothetical protein
MMAFDVNSVPLSLTIIFGLPRSPIVARPVHISDSFMAGMGSYGADGLICRAPGRGHAVAPPRRVMNVRRFAETFSA